MSATGDFEYVVEGDDFQHLVVKLAPRGAIRAEPGSFMWMESGIEMDTSTGGGLMSGLKRKLAGESFFITTFSNASGGPRTVGFAAPTPGKILCADLARGTLLCQRNAYLCSTTEAEISVAFTKRFGAGFLAGAQLALDDRAAGVDLRVDTGCLVAFEGGVDYDIEMMKGVKTMLFGGEGLFFARLRGPGKVWLQTIPFSRLADRILSAAGGSRGEHRRGGGLLGDLLQGD